MSKRSEEKEKLARQLDAGEITQARFDERMARLTSRGKSSRSAANHRRMAAHLRDRGKITQGEYEQSIAMINRGETPKLPKIEEWKPGGGDKPKRK